MATSLEIELKIYHAFWLRTIEQAGSNYFRRLSVIHSADEQACELVECPRDKTQATASDSAVALNFKFGEARSRSHYLTCIDFRNSISSGSMS